MKIGDPQIEAIKEESLEFTSSQQVTKEFGAKTLSSKQSQDQMLKFSNRAEQINEVAENSIDQAQHGTSLEQQRLLPKDEDLGVTINTNYDDNEADWMVDLGSDMLSGDTMKRSD